mgnify:CR=1 FL=1
MPDCGGFFKRAGKKQAGLYCQKAGSPPRFPPPSVSALIPVSQCTVMPILPVSASSQYILPFADVAQSIGVHESTVSRAVKDKYLQCDRGVYFRPAAPAIPMPSRYFATVRREIRTPSPCSSSVSSLSLRGFVLSSRSINARRRCLTLSAETASVPPLLLSFKERSKEDCRGTSSADE